MTENFLKLMKDVAKTYNIEITENSLNGGIFYKDEENNLVKVSNYEHNIAIDEFCTPIGADFVIADTIYPVENILVWAA